MSIDFILIGIAETLDAILFNSAIWNVNVFSRDVNVIEESITHKVIITLFVIFLDRIVFIQVEGNHILER